MVSDRFYVAQVARVRIVSIHTDAARAFPIRRPSLIIGISSVLFGKVWNRRHFKACLRQSPEELWKPCLHWAKITAVGVKQCLSRSGS